MRHAWTALACAAAAMAGAARLDAQSTPREVIVSVVDDAGAPVTGLAAADFEVREDDIRREVLRVGPARGDRHVAVLIDTSEAAVPAVSDLRRGLAAFVDGRPPAHQVSLVTFGGPPRILVETTRDAARLHDGIGRVFPQSGQAAYLLDAMREVTEGFVRRASPRPVMVVLTAEGVDYSTRNARDVLDHVAESGAAVYAFTLAARPTPFAAGPDRFELDRGRIERNLVLQRGPDQSGGRRRDLLASSALEPMLRTLAAELQQQYLVVYARPDTLIPPEQVRVAVTRPGLTARGTLVRLDREGAAR